MNTFWEKSRPFRPTDHNRSNSHLTGSDVFLLLHQISLCMLKQKGTVSLKATLLEQWREKKNSPFNLQCQYWIRSKMPAISLDSSPHPRASRRHPESQGIDQGRLMRRLRYRPICRGPSSFLEGAVPHSISMCFWVAVRSNNFNQSENPSTATSPNFEPTWPSPAGLWMFPTPRAAAPDDASAANMGGAPASVRPAKPNSTQNMRALGFSNKSLENQSNTGPSSCCVRLPFLSKGSKRYDDTPTTGLTC